MHRGALRRRPSGAAAARASRRRVRVRGEAHRHQARVRVAVGRHADRAHALHDVLHLRQPAARLVDARAVAQDDVPRVATIASAAATIAAWPPPPIHRDRRQSPPQAPPEAKRGSRGRQPPCINLFPPPSRSFTISPSGRERVRVIAVPVQLYSCMSMCMSWCMEPAARARNRARACYCEVIIRCVPWRYRICTVAVPNIPLCDRQNRVILVLVPWLYRSFTVAVP